MRLVPLTARVIPILADVPMRIFCDVGSIDLFSLATFFSTRRLADEP